MNTRSFACLGNVPDRYAITSSASTLPMVMVLTGSVFKYWMMRTIWPIFASSSSSMLSNRSCLVTRVTFLPDLYSGIMFLREVDEPIPSNTMIICVGCIWRINAPNERKNPPNPPIWAPFEFTALIAEKLRKKRFNPSISM